MFTTNARRVVGESSPKAQHVPAARNRQSVVANAKGPTGEDPHTGFSDEEWRDMVATAAYFRCASRGFQEGSADEDWYEAEAELRERLSAV